MKTPLLAGLSAILTIVSTEAEIIGTVDPATKTITFEGSLERLPQSLAYSWEFGPIDFISDISVQRSLGIAGQFPNRFSLGEGTTSGKLAFLSLIDDDGNFSDLSQPIVADPSIPYSYAWASSGAINAFESALAFSDIVAENRYDPNLGLGQTNGPLP